jgi:hypothetical protein
VKNHKNEKVNKDNASRLAELKNPPYLKVGIYSLLANIALVGKARVKLNFKS